MERWNSTYGVETVHNNTYMETERRQKRAFSSVSFPFPYRYYYGLSPLHRCYSIFPSRLLCILSTSVLHRLLLLLLLSRCLFRLFRVPFRSLLISVTPQLLIVVFLARAPECIVPKSCCLSCPHLDLVTLQSNLPISV